MLLTQTLEQWSQAGAAHTAAEIAQQPQLWRKLLQNLNAQKTAIQDFLKRCQTANTKVVFTGAGTSEFVGNTLVPYLKSTGIDNLYSISSTDLVLAPESYISSKDEIMLVSCARSGNSPESVAAARLAENIAASCHHFILTCDMAGQLAQNYQGKANCYILEMDGANDQGFAMTGSFTCMTLAGSLIFQLEQLDTFCQAMAKWPEAVEAYMGQIAQTIVQLARLRKPRIICLGSAGNKGIGQEAHLKMLELSASHNVANFDSALSFRHGPKSVLNDESIVFFFCSSDSYTLLYELDMLRELMTDKGQHQVVAISPQPLPDAAKLCDCSIIHPDNPVPGPVGRILSSLVHIVTGQLYALQNSVNLGVRPDNPSPSGSVNRVVQGVHIYPYKK